MTYSEKLQNPAWQKKRLEILNRDCFTCMLCGDTQTTLHIHHKEYVKGREPWQYADDNFSTLCKHCHSFEEALRASDVPLHSLFINKNVCGSGLVIMFAIVKGPLISIVVGDYENHRCTLSASMGQAKAVEFVEMYLHILKTQQS